MPSHCLVGSIGFLSTRKVCVRFGAIPPTDAELFGRVLHVNVARPMQASMGSRKAVWADADQWYQESLGTGEGEQPGDAGLGGAGPAEPRPLENALRPAVAGVGSEAGKQ